MNDQTRMQRALLLRKYYKSACLGWFHPKSLHWAKIVTAEGYWKWARATNGIRGRFLKNPPIHVYQTVLRFKTEEPPRGKKTLGYLLGGPLLFDADLSDKGEPFSLWKIIHSGQMIREMKEAVQDRGEYKLGRVMFSGFRGIHVSFEKMAECDPPILLKPDRRSRNLQSVVYIRKQSARALGYWCPGWDWKVSSDLWRVSRVPWSIHGTSALRAIVLRPPYNVRSLGEQMQRASPFSFTRNLRVRMKRMVPLFTFVDGETYGPYRRGWTTKLPIAVACHLIWQDFAKPREYGPTRIESWFGRDWQTLFRHRNFVYNLDSVPTGGAGS